ncbi:MULTISPECIES: erythromycin esterase family protein [Flavobacterium]|uniref:Erythromycin esterase family protein n=1 Tax=Flavobacterium jumunjinense TaxID=998845 RepID=A0ABV5GJX1_9FLAO|nr:MULTISPECIES: erythromycin esterase family protein [Flavobacterium]
MKSYLLLLFSILSFGQTSIKGDLKYLESNDYSFLNKILENKRIVLLGEQSHGDGATFDEKVEIIKYLHEKLGFNTIAFEGGFYDNYKASQLFLNKKENSSIYNESIFSIWSDTQSFQDLFLYIEERAKNKDTIRITGFDCQEGVLFEKYFISDLKTIFASRKIKVSPLQIEKIEKAFVYRDLDLIAFSKTDSISLYKDFDYIVGAFEKMTTLTLHEKIIQQVFKSSLANVNFEIAQIQKQKIAVQNPRDEQMAQNFIFLAETYPKEKIIGWGASYHFAKEISNLEIDTLTEDYFSQQSDLEKKATGYTDYKKGEGKQLLEGGVPMGKLLKEHFKEKMYTIAFSSYEGNYGIVNSNTYPILTPPENSIEKQLSNQDKAFFEFDDEKKESFYCLALGNMPIKGNWQTNFDALVFIKKSYQPSVRKYNESDFKKGSFSGFIAKGYVFDKETNLPINTVEVVWGNNEKATLTKENGSFEFIIDTSDLTKFLKVNAFGYASDSIQVNLEKKSYEFKLNKSKLGGIVLDEVVLNSDKKELIAINIIKKAKSQLKENYYQKGYNQTFYYKQNSIKNEEETIKDEAIITFYNPKGINSGNDKVYGKVDKLKKTPNKEEKYTFTGAFGLISLWNRELITIKSNPLYRTNSYTYTKEGFETIKGKKAYKIHFKNTSPGSYSTGYGYPAPKSSSGYLYIDCDSFAVLKYEHSVERAPFDLKDDSNRTVSYSHTISETYQYNNGFYFIDELTETQKNNITSTIDEHYLMITYTKTTLKSTGLEVKNLEVIKEPLKLNFGASTTFNEDLVFWESMKNF